MTENNCKMYVVRVNSKKVVCGERTIQYWVGETYRTPYPIQPTKGDKHDYQTCENCKEIHRRILESLTKRNDAFPNCCEAHKRLWNLNAFNKDDFKDAHIQCADKIIYCYNHILNNQNKSNWKHSIENYINDVTFSFGCMPKGYGGALFLDTFYAILKELVIAGDEFIREDVKLYVCKHLDKLILPQKEFDPIESLLRIYNNWLNLFPFDFSEFNKVKKEFANQTPLFLQTMREHNGRVSYRLSSNKELIGWLNQQSKKLLKIVKLEGRNIRLVDVYRKSIKAKELDIREKELLEECVEEESIYIRTLVEWLDIQKEKIELLNEYGNIECEVADSFQESLRRIDNFKLWIESQHGARHLAQMQSLKETDLQDLFEGLCTINDNSSCRNDREVNNGRGPVDFIASKGRKDSTIIEFKLASNTSLETNILYQVDAYKRANITSKAIIVIFCFTLEEKNKVEVLLKNIEGKIKDHIIIIDCRSNKPSASKIKNESEL